MNNGNLTRLIIAKILHKLKNSKTTFEDHFKTYIKNYNINNQNKKMIYSIVLTTMRNIFTIDQILGSYIKKLNKKDLSYYLIISAIAQICFLNYKSYAVIYSTCEAYKNSKGIRSVKFINGSNYIFSNKWYWSHASLGRNFNT